MTLSQLMHQLTTGAYNLFNCKWQCQSCVWLQYTPYGDDNIVPPHFNCNLWWQNSCQTLDKWASQRISSGGQLLRAQPPEVPSTSTLTTYGPLRLALVSPRWPPPILVVVTGSLQLSLDGHMICLVGWIIDNWCSCSSTALAGYKASANGVAEGNTFSFHFNFGLNRSHFSSS